MRDLLKGIPSKRLGLDPESVEVRLLELQGQLRDKDQALFKVQTEFVRLKEEYGQALKERETTKTRVVAIGEALVLAQAAASEIRRQAQDEANALTEEARAGAQALLAEAGEEAQRIVRDRESEGQQAVLRMASELERLEGAKARARKELIALAQDLRSILDRLTELTAEPRAELSGPGEGETRAEPEAMESSQDEPYREALSFQATAPMTTGAPSDDPAGDYSGAVTLADSGPGTAV